MSAEYRLVRCGFSCPTRDAIGHIAATCSSIVTVLAILVRQHRPALNNQRQETKLVLGSVNEGHAAHYLDGPFAGDANEE